MAQRKPRVTSTDKKMRVGPKPHGTKIIPWKSSGEFRKKAGPPSGLRRSSPPKRGQNRRRGIR